MLKAKSLAFGTPATGWWEARPVLLSFFTAGLFKIGLGEMTVRLCWVALSTASLVLVYRIGTILFNKRVGLYAVALGSVSYGDVFYTMRLLVDAPPVFFVTLAGLLLVSSLARTGSAHAAWAVVPVIVLGAMLRFTTAIFLAIVVLFLLVVTGPAVLRAREWQVSLALGALTSLPLLLYFASLYGNPLHPFVSHMVLRGPLAIGAPAPPPAEVSLEYVRHFPRYTHPLVVVVFLAGLVQAVAVTALHVRRLRQHRVAQGYVLLLLWIVVPFVFFGFFVNTFQDRFLLMIFPAVFLLTATGLDAAYVQLERLSPVVAIAAVAAVVGYGGYQMAVSTDAIVRQQLTSYDGIRDAGAWIRGHSRPGDTIISSSVTQNTYYSERATFGYPDRASDFADLLKDKAPRYMVLSRWERSPEWAYEWPQRNSGRVSVASAFFPDESRKQAMVIVYVFR